MYGDWEALGALGEWKSATAGVAADGALFIVAGGDLWRVSPEDGSYEAVGEGGWDTHHLAVVGDTLFAVEHGGTLLRVDAHSGAHDELEGDWRHTTAAVGHGAHLYLADGETLWRVDARSGEHVEVETETTWPEAHLLASVGNVLCVATRAGSLCRVSPEPPTQWAQLGGDWTHANAMVGHRGRLYVQDGGGWYVVHPVEDVFDELPCGDGWRTRLALALGDALFAVEQGGTLYRMRVRAGDAPST